MLPQTRIKVGTQPFCLADEYQNIADDHHDGAVVSFIGKVRDFNLGQPVTALTLEHYPGMTERSLAAIVDQARRRFMINHITLHHRVGTFSLGDEIVLVLVSAAHRGAAFQASEYIMDQLKTTAPFWKREQSQAGSRWLTPRVSDQQAQARWDERKESQ